MYPSLTVRVIEKPITPVSVFIRYLEQEVVKEFKFRHW